MPEQGVIERVARGAVAGFVGTLALYGAETASQWWLPQTMPPFRKDPGEFMVERVEAALPSAISERVPNVVELAAAKGLAVGYGLSVGMVYALVRPRGGSVLVDGLAFGLGVWTAGYLGWLSMLGFMPPLSEQNTAAVISPALRHVLFGVVTVAAYRWLQTRAGLFDSHTDIA